MVLVDLKHIGPCYMCMRETRYCLSHFFLQPKKGDKTGIFDSNTSLFFWSSNCRGPFYRIVGPLQQLYLCEKAVPLTSGSASFEASLLSTTPAKTNIAMPNHNFFSRILYCISSNVCFSIVMLVFGV